MNPGGYFILQHLLFFAVQILLPLLLSRVNGGRTLLKNSKTLKRWFKINNS